MASWETCQIEEVIMRESRFHDGLFGSSETPGQCHWEARVTDSSGGVNTIHKSVDYDYIWSMSNPKLLDKYKKESDAAHYRLIADLSKDGWQPVASDERGRVTLMNRPVASPQGEADALSKLERLGQLRTQGLIDEQEFKAAKAKLLGL